ncbi:MAG: lipopolysaccharide export system protein LptA [Gammaproteobacteria bacterium]|jgi:lipopolysaccharide export system protein LptA
MNQLENKQPLITTAGMVPDMALRFATLAIVALLAILWTPRGGALSTDREQNIEIEADSAEQDDVKGLAIYKGDVVITQGTLKITGDHVTIHYDGSGDFTKMVTLGNPAHFDQLPDGQANIAANYQRAKASRMEYFKATDTIVLLGNAIYGQGGDKVAADRIDYDSRNGRMKARTVTAAKGKGKPAKKPGRVRITLKPKKKSN